MTMHSICNIILNIDTIYELKILFQSHVTYCNGSFIDRIPFRTRFCTPNSQLIIKSGMIIH